MVPHCLLQVLLLLALAALWADACDITEMGQQTEAMNEKCCENGACNGVGVPPTCSASCAPVFETFWKDCGAYLNYLPGAEAMSDFALKCEKKKPDDAGSKTTSCDSGTLLSTLFFACSGIDQNNAGSFCGTACSEGVENFLKRCEEATDADKGVIKQAEQWMQQCNADASGSKSIRCHASDCRTGAQSNEPHCAKATTRGACAGLSSADNNVFCRWQHCQTHGGAPSPPPLVVPGCTDSKAMNYNPKATVTANGACLYPEPPPPPPYVPPSPPSIPCTAAHYYGCKNKAECESVKMQWLPCSVLEKYGTNCGQGSDDPGTCTLPCTNASPHNCHTQDTCLAAGLCQSLGAAPHQVGCQNLTTEWYSPAPRHDQGPIFPECIRGCSVGSMGTCKSQSSCEAIGMQWVLGVVYKDANGVVVREQMGRCERKCTKGGNAYDCHSRAQCEAADLRWAPSICCGTSCGTAPQGQDDGSCATKCSLARPFDCDDQVSCEAVGKQWVVHTAGDGYQTKPVGCTAVWPTGHCERACTADDYSWCKTKVDCEAVGLKWTPPQMHGNFMEAGRCSYSCTLSNPDQCDTETECTGIGYQWTTWKREFSGFPVEGAKQAYCQEPCAGSFPQGCHSQIDCEAAQNQWVIEGIVEPGGPPPPQHRRGLQEAPSPAPPQDLPGIRWVGRCMDGCHMGENDDGTHGISSCRSRAACEKASGKWTDTHLPPCPNFMPEGIPCSVPWGPHGNCQQSCSTASPRDCRSKGECEAIGGSWKSKANLGRPRTMTCDVTTAPCDIGLFVAQCGKTGAENVELCDDKCGRFIMRNYDHCSAHPPKGMSKAQWKTHFGPIVSMCKSFHSDPTLNHCARRVEESTVVLNKLCCTDKTQCQANGGTPTKCSGACADAFLPFFAECGAVLAGKGEKSSLGKFYRVCTASNAQIGPDKKLCHANSGNAPFVAISFRRGCEVWIKYVDAKTKAESPVFVQLVSVGRISIGQIQEVARRVCGKLTMIQRLAEDFSGLLALNDIDEKGDTLKITVNHPATGNTEVEVTNTPANKAAVKASGWKQSFNVNVFSPEHCPPK